MKSLPEGHRFYRGIDLPKSPLLGLINITATVLMILLGIRLAPKGEGTVLGFQIVLYCLLAIGGIAAYVLLHEWIHGILMKRFSGMKPRYGYNGVCAFAGSRAYFSKRQYLMIALAPVILLGAMLAALNIACYPRAFWYIYVIQIVNISGAAGDVYVTALMLGMPRDILIQDTGTRMRCYSAEGKGEH